MKLKKKIAALLMITTIWSTSLIAQASCKVTHQQFLGSYRATTWSCNDGDYHTISKWDGDSWVIIYNTRME